MLPTSLAVSTLGLAVVLGSTTVACAVDADEESMGSSVLAAKKNKGEKKKGDDDVRAAATETALVFYNLNVENVPSPDWDKCEGSGLDFPKYLGAVNDAPHVFTVQQLSGRPQANAYVDALQQATGQPYAAILADETPRAYTSGCPGLKDLQTNAILFRTDRFALVDGSVVQFQPKRSATDSCGDGDKSTLSRTLAVGAKLRDLKGSNTVGVVSMHFPRDDNGCMKVNADDALDRLEKIGGNLRIIAGDANTRDRVGGGDWAPWYQRVLGRGYADPIHAACNGDKSCVANNWSFESDEGTQSRIDFVFAQRASGQAPGIQNAATITYADVRKVAGTHPTLPYSDHRAIRTRFAF